MEPVPGAAPVGPGGSPPRPAAAPPAAAEVREMAEDVEIMRRLLAETVDGLYGAPVVLATIDPLSARGQTNLNSYVLGDELLSKARADRVATGVAAARPTGAAPIYGAFVGGFGTIYQLRLPAPRPKLPASQSPAPARKPDRWEQTRQQIRSQAAGPARPAAEGAADFAAPVDRNVYALTRRKPRGGADPYSAHELALLRDQVTTPGSGWYVAGDGAPAPVPDAPKAGAGQPGAVYWEPWTSKAAGTGVNRHLVWLTARQCPASRSPTQEELVEAVVKLIGEYGHKFRHLSAGEQIAVAFTFDRCPTAATTAATRAPVPTTPPGEPTGKTGPIEPEAPPAPVAYSSRHGTVRSATWESAGDLHSKQGAYDKAIDAYRKALGFAPSVAKQPPSQERVGVYRKLAQAYLGLGKDRDAKTMLELIEKAGTTTTPPAATPGRRVLPAQLTISVSKGSADDFAEGHIELREFRRLAKIDFRDPAAAAPAAPPSQPKQLAPPKAKPPAKRSGTTATPAEP